MAKSKAPKGVKVGDEIEVEPGFVRLPDGAVTGHHGSFTPRIDGEHVFTDREGNEIQTVDVAVAE